MKDIFKFFVTQKKVKIFLLIITFCFIWIPSLQAQEHSLSDNPPAISDQEVKAVKRKPIRTPKSKVQISNFLKKLSPQTKMELALLFGTTFNKKHVLTTLGLNRIEAQIPPPGEAPYVVDVYNITLGDIMNLKRSLCRQLKSQSTEDLTCGAINPELQNKRNRIYQNFLKRTQSKVAQELSLSSEKIQELGL